MSVSVHLLLASFNLLSRGRIRFRWMRFNNNYVEKRFSSKKPLQLSGGEFIIPKVTNSNTSFAMTIYGFTLSSEFRVRAAFKSNNSAWNAISVERKNHSAFGLK